jgi:16S rRNA (uracil1498-N3)-methyltransferase
MQRFYLSPELFDGDYVISDDRDFIKQLSGVLRAKEGEKFAVFNGDGQERLVQLLNLSKKEAKFLIIDNHPSTREQSLKVNLFLALIKADKLEWAVQKSVELGVASITPIVCERSVVKDLSPNKTKRLSDIIKESTEQCGGSILAVLHPVLPYRKALFIVEKSNGQKLIAWENEMENQLKDFKSEEINLFVGPEGGFSLAEIAQAQELKFTTVSLGCRILRAETAPVVALAALFSI